ncbi:uncharacterized protein MONBRDRAFT_25236 [Monosiga brevicollis MX1]|uniref:Uncharacterized protein n=1 Tax=Monosiga brevicollis TaxID=81824 RepID=A9UYT6_MONBE|nr:uncharacterized protein MONBRDRAFT_25236 [Monosiga brevicollis MX1]EDQ89663.1 predicted protein [Monosiga brevicollis MX1]|eukprot:XP_001745692.1 hypothetical protein [Monosiga brevicollis MX1]
MSDSEPRNKRPHRFADEFGRFYPDLQAPAELQAVCALCTELLPSDPLHALDALDIELLGMYRLLLGSDAPGQLHANTEALLQLAAEDADSDDEDEDADADEQVAAAQGPKDAARGLAPYMLDRRLHDVPEVFPIARRRGQPQEHWCYFYPDPTAAPVGVVFIDDSQSGTFSPAGDSLLALLVAEAGKLPDQKSFVPKLKACADQGHISLHPSKAWRQHQATHKLAKTWNKLGICVPYNPETEIGYRELTVTKPQLRKMLQTLIDADGSAQPSSQSDVLVQERGVDCDYRDFDKLLQYANISNDEMDFGQGLELGERVNSSPAVSHTTPLLCKNYQAAVSLVMCCQRYSRGNNNPMARGARTGGAMAYGRPRIALFSPHALHARRRQAPRANL